MINNETINYWIAYSKRIIDNEFKKKMLNSKKKEDTW